MASLVEIQRLVQQIKDDLPLLINRSQIAPKQIVTVKGLSDISERLGLVQAGEFRAGNGNEPGFGFTGVRIGYPAFSYSGDTWHIAGVNNDTLQIGISATAGKMIAGAGDVTLDADGIWITNQMGAFGFEDTAGTRFNLYIYSDGVDDLVLKNKTGGNSVRMDVDSATHGVMRLDFGENATEIPTLFIGDVSSGVADHAKFTMGGSGGNVIQSGQNGVETVFNEGGYDINHRIETADNSVAFNLDGAANQVTSLAWSGWESVWETWTYAGAQSFTISGDVTNKYRIGTRIRCYNNSTYFLGVIRSSTYAAPNTTITMIANNDYSLANSAITSGQISYLDNPQDFAAYFNWTPTWSGITIGNATVTAKWVCTPHGRMETMVVVDMGTTTNFGAAAAWAMSVPSIPTSMAQDYMPMGKVHYLDLATAVYVGDAMWAGGGSGYVELRAFGVAGTYSNLAYVTNTVPMTWTSDDFLFVHLDYFLS